MHSGCQLPPFLVHADQLLFIRCAGALHIRCHSTHIARKWHVWLTRRPWLQTIASQVQRHHLQPDATLIQPRRDHTRSIDTMAVMVAN